MTASAPNARIGRFSFILICVLLASLVMNVWLLSRQAAAMAVAPTSSSSPATAGIRPSHVAEIPRPREASANPVEPGSAASERPALSAPMISDPTFRQTMLNSHKLEIIARYTELFKKLVGKGVAVDRLRDMLAEEKTAIQQLMLQARADGLDSVAVNGMIQERRAVTDGELRALLGAENYADYMSYRESLSARSVADELSLRLGYTNEPLTAEQRAWFVQSVQASAGSLSLRDRMLYDARTAMGATYNLPISDDLIKSAEGKLSDLQLSTLIQMAIVQMDKGDLDTKYYHARKTKK